VTESPQPDIEPDQLPRALFGYDRSAIVELLETMSAKIRDLEHERVERERRIGELEQELEQGRENERLIAETLLRAQEQAERMVAEAELAAGERAAVIIAKAQEERQAVIDEARQEKQALLEEAGRARAFVDETHEQLSDFLMAAVRWYEQAKPAVEGRDQAARELNERSSMPSSAIAALTRESQSTSSSTGRSEE
jgi:cell division septum initiation protein DivIVA